MNNFHIEGQDYIPEIYFDATKKELNISGESYHEYTVEFYQPVFEWVANFLKTPKMHISLNFKMSYFNTSSSRRFLELLNMLEEYQHTQNGSVVVNWYYEEDDPDMLETGEEYENDVDLKFNLVPLATAEM